MSAPPDAQPVITSAETVIAAIAAKMRFIFM
jgi:hypothetical protein